MAFFDDLKGKAKDLAQAGVAKSKQLTELSKLNLDNASEEDALRKAYLELGKLYYADHGAQPEAAYIDCCRKISGVKANIAANKTHIAELKAEGGIQDDEITLASYQPPLEDQQEDQEDEKQD